MMIPKITNLKELAQYLQGQAGSEPDSRITLTDEPPFEAIMTVVSDVLGIKKLILEVRREDIPDDPTDTLVIKNAFTPHKPDETFLRLIGQQTEITFWFAKSESGVSQILHLSMLVILRQWNFGTSFDEMSGLSVNDLIPQDTPPNFAFSSAETIVIDPSTKKEISIKKGLNYLSKVNLEAANAFFAILDSKPPELSISGPITLVKEGYIFDLRAPLVAQPKPLPNLKVSSPWIGMKAVYVYYDDSPEDRSKNADNNLEDNEDEAKYTLLAYPYLGFEIEIKRTENCNTASMTLDLETYFQPNLNEIIFLILPADPTQTSLDNIGNLIGGTTWNDLIPQDFRNNYLKRFALKTFSLSLNAENLSLKTMTLDLGTIEPWPIPYTNYELDFDLDWSVLWLDKSMLQAAELSAKLKITEDFVFFVKVSIPDMVISGGYIGTLEINFQRLAEKIKDLSGSLPIPDGLPEFSFSDLFLTIDSKTGGFSIEATADADISLFGTKVLGIRGLYVVVSRPNSKERVSVALNGIVEILDIGFEISADIPAGGDTVFEIHMVNQTVGSLLQYLVRLVDPYFELSLDAPWNALLDISLDALVLKVNVTQGIVYLNYNTNIHLGFIDISGLGLIYQKARDKEEGGKKTHIPSSVQISLDCTFLGIKYGDGNVDPLSWDPMKDPAPSVAGKAPLFDLNYMGLGQHVTPYLKDETSMLEIVEAMQTAMVPVEDAEVVPAELPGIRFQRESHWLIASRFSVMGVVEILAIFNDPNLYGIRIGLSGEKAGKLKGLQFEILYRKVTPTIGLYHIELTLPDIMRHLEFGAVSITLPVVVLDLYTNGNFRIDLGFPRGLDFSRSFSLQIFPFVGYGGLYFALLSGETSKKVPQISNGTFDPVIEFGLGLSLGVGKDIDKGPLKAGLSITVVGILEGVLAWFHPDSNDVPRECYYHIQGAVAVMGKLYGSVDFAIIKAEVQVVAYASIVLTVESHKPIYIALEASVSIKASLKVLFITVHFSFSATIKASFTIGSITPTPWKVVEGGGVSGQRQLSARPSVHRHLYSNAALAADSLECSRYEMDWSPVCVSHLVHDTHELRSLRMASWDSKSTAAIEATSESKEEIRIIVSPAFTQAAGQHLAAYDACMSGDGGVATQAVLLPLIENGIPPGSNTTSEIRKVAEDATDRPFIKLISRLLAWTIQAQLSSIHSPSPVVTAADLCYVYEQLNSDDIEQNGFTYENLVAFLKSNFLLVLEARQEKEQDINASVFPIPPALTMTHDGAGAPVDFGSHNPVNKSYQEKIDLYLKQMRVEYENTVESNYYRRMKGPEDAHLRNMTAPVGDPSLATKIFQNYFLMMARTAVQSAIDLLNEYRYSITIPAGESSPSLAEIARTFSASETLYTTCSGDTLQQVADRYGILVSTLKRANPDVSSKNPDDPLPAGINLVVLIGALAEITTNKGDTLNSLSESYQIPIQIIRELNPCVSSLEPEESISPGTPLLLPVTVTSESIALANQDDAEILNAGKKAGLKGILYQVMALADGYSETLKSIAEKFDKEPVFLDQLLTANRDKAILQEGLLLTFNQDTSGIVYTSHEGDSISLVAAIFAVRISGPTVYNYFNGLVQMVQDILKRNPDLKDPAAPIKPGTTLSIELPSGIVVSYVTNPLDTPTMVAAYFLCSAGGPMNLNEFIFELIKLNNLENIDPDKPINPGTRLKIPTFSYSIRTGDSLERIHNLFNVDAVKLAETQDLLYVHATLDIPAFQYTIAEHDTFRGIAQKCNLSLSTIVASIVSLKGLFKDKITIIIPRVPARHTADLIDDLVKNGDLNQAASMISRFMLHGLRLPINDKGLQSLNPHELYGSKIASKVTTGPLYELTGQQFTIPDTAAEGYEIGITAKDADWISFGMSDYYALKGATIDDLSSRFALDKQDFEKRLKELNPGVTYPLEKATWLKFPPEMKLKALAVNLTKEEITQVKDLGKPFTPRVSRLQRQPLFNELPLRYSLERRIPWQAAVLPEGVSLASDQQKVTAPSIWTFPGYLQSRLKGMKEGSPMGNGYELMMSARGDGDFSHFPVRVGPYMWGTKVDLRVQVVASPDQNGRLPNIYRLIGTDEAGRELLQKVYSYSGGVRSYLLYKAAPTSANATGLISDKINLNRTFILRTNLSTLSQSGPVSLLMRENRDISSEEPTSSEYDAPISEGKDFVKLLWECSVVYSGGYYLNYITDDGGDLPDYLFAEGSEAVLSMLIIMGDSKNAPCPLVEAHNCAVVGQNIDAENASLFVQAVSYIVGIDDSLKIAVEDLNKSHGLTLTAAALAAANQKTKNLLREGAELEIGSGKYRIIYGDTLASIADKNQLAVEALINIGNNAQARILEPGSIMVVCSGEMHQTSTAPAGNTGFQLVCPAPEDGPSDQTMDPTTYLDNLFQLLDYGITPKYRFAASARGLPIGPLDHSSEVRTDNDWHYQKILPVYRYANDGLGSDIASLDPNAALPPMAGNPYRGIHTSSGNVDDQKVSLDLCFIDVYGNRTVSEALQPLEIPIGYFDDLIGLASWPGISASHMVRPHGGDVHINIPLRFKMSQYIPGSDIPLADAIRNACAHRAKYAQILYQIWQPDLEFLLRTSMDQLPESTSVDNESYPSDTVSPSRKPYKLDTSQKLSLACTAASIYSFLTACCNLRAYNHKISSIETFEKVADYYGTDVAGLFRENADAKAVDIFSGTEISVPEFKITRQGDSIGTIIGYVFSWTKIPGTDDERLREVLGKRYHIDWAYTAKISKSEDEKTISMSNEDATHSLTLNNKDPEVILKVDNIETDKFIARKENGELNIYRIGCDLPLEHNLYVPLNVGLDLVTPSLRDYYPSRGDTLRNIAKEMQADAAQIAQANEMHVLNEDKSISIYGKSLPVLKGDSLKSMVEQFKDTYQILTSAADLGKANQDTSDLFDMKEEKKLVIADYLIQEGDTLKSIHDKYGWAPKDIIIIENNRELINLFVPGTALQIKEKLYTIRDSDTLGSIAGQFNVAVDALAPLNAVKMLKENGKLAIPSVVDLDESALPNSVFEVRGSDRLRDIASKYIDPQSHQPLKETALADLNRSTPYLFSPGKEIKVDDKKIVIQEADTFASLYQRLQDLGYTGSFDEFVQSIALKDGIVQQGSVFACPPINAGTGKSLSGIADAYGLDALSLAEVNSSLRGLLKSGKISYKGKDILVGDDDTLCSLVNRFAREKIDLTLKDISSSASFSGIIKDEAWMLPPPIINNLDITVTSEPVNPKQIFPVTVELEMARHMDLVDPDFRDTTSVFQAQTPIVPTTDDYLFIWEDVPGKDSERLLAFLKQDFGAVWVDAATIKKIDGNKTIIISKGDKSLKISLDQEDEKAILEINGIEYTFKTKKEKDGLKIYQDSDYAGQALTRYARQFEAAFKGFIKVATGKSAEEGDNASKRGIWAVDFRPGALSFDIKGYDKISGNNTEAVYFALKPLANSLASGEKIEVYPYESGVGLNPDKKEYCTFQAIDLDVWAREFLAALDLFLSPEYAIPTCNLPDNDGLYHYRRVMSCKDELAKSIGEGLSQVFKDGTGDIAEAKEALIQRLLIELSNAYDIDTVVQLPVDTASRDPADVLTARLSGKPLVKAGLAKADESAGDKAEVAYSLSTAKVNLMHSEKPSRLTFLVNVKDKAAYKNLKLDLRYAINEIEYDISSVGKIAGYQASSWLTLILPIGSEKEARMLTALPMNEGKSLDERAQIGTVSIPIPLRSYPAPPSLVDQSRVTKDKAIFYNSIEETIRELTSWKYSYSFDYQSAEQDTLYPKVSFTSGNGKRSLRDSNYKSLFEQLAQFIYIYPSIKEDLTLLTSPLLEATDSYALKAAKSAVKAFADIVAGSEELKLMGVSQAWREYAGRRMSAEEKSGIVYEYRMGTNREKKELTLEGITSTVGSYIWPDIDALVWDAGSKTFKSYSLDPIPGCMDNTNEARKYSLKKVPGESSRYKFTFSGLNIITHQTGLGAIRVTRNENLGKCLGKTVENSFIYQTPIVAFSTPFTPMIVSDEDVNLRENDETLEDALYNLFNYLCPDRADSNHSSEPINIKIACRYGYKMNCTKTFLPILLIPRFDFQISCEWKRSFADQLASRLQEWKQAAKPAEEKGTYSFDISIYAGKDGVVDQPLLNVSNLYYELENS